MDGADGDALQAQHLVVELGQHPANLAVLALVQHDLQPGAFALTLEPANPACLDMAITQPDALEQFLDFRALTLAGDLYEIGPLDAVARMHERACQVAVI